MGMLENSLALQFSFKCYTSGVKLPKYVREKPEFIKYFPFIGEYTANSIYPWILVPKDVYKNLKSPIPNPYNLALLIHEQKHYERQKKMGSFWFGIKYLFSAKFRFNEELVAVKEAMKYLKKNKIPFDFDKKAKILSSYLYLWPVSKHYAEEKLRQVWEEV